MNRTVPRSWGPQIAREAIILARRREALRAEVDRWEDERDSLASYIPAVHRTDEGAPAHPPAHVRRFIAALEDDSLGHTVIIAPPGSAKTNTLIATTAWQIGHEPTRHFGYFSNTGPQAYRRSVAIRDTLARSPAYRAIFPEIAPDYTKGWGEAEWYLARPDVADKDPTLLAAGVGGAIMGARLDRFALDDIADPKNMATPYQREKVRSWIAQTLMTRLTPRARGTMIATRWAPDDPVGWAIEQGWHVVRIKAIGEDGESYWPERWPVNKLACPNNEHGKADPAWVASEQHPEPPCWVEYNAQGEIIRQGRCAKATMTEREFNLVYQGETTDDASAIFKRAFWRRWPAGERFPTQTAGIFVDLAHEEKTTADYTVIARWLWGPPNALCADVVKRRWEFPEVLALLRCLVKDQIPEEQWPKHPDVLYTLMRLGRASRLQPAPWRGFPIVIEDTPGSKPLIQTLRREVPGTIGWKIGGHSKLARANAVAYLAEAGNLYLPEGAPWAGDFIEEHAAFTGDDSGHDDQVDTTTMALLRFTRGGNLVSW